jgi:hypothetical protein
MKEKKKKLTTAAGAPVVDNQNVITAGPRGPMLMQDVWFLEKMANFDREVIPERRMHAKGSGAFGNFTVTHDITRYTKAKIFSAIGKENRCFCSAFLRLPENEERLMPSEISGDLLLNFIPKKETGTWWETIPRFSFCEIH